MMPHDIFWIIIAAVCGSLCSILIGWKGKEGWDRSDSAPEKTRRTYSPTVGIRATATKTDLLNALFDLRDSRDFNHRQWSGWEAAQLRWLAEQIDEGYEVERQTRLAAAQAQTAQAKETN